MSTKRSQTELTDIEKSFIESIENGDYAKANKMLDKKNNEGLTNLKYKFTDTDRPIQIIRRIVSKYSSVEDASKQDLIDLMIKTSNLTTHIDALSLSFYPFAIDDFGVELTTQLIENGFDVEIKRNNATPIERICKILEKHKSQKNIDAFKPFVEQLLFAGATTDKGSRKQLIAFGYGDIIDSVNRGDTLFHLAFRKAFQAKYKDQDTAPLLELLKDYELDLTTENDLGDKLFFTPTLRSGNTAILFTNFCLDNFEFLGDDELLEPLIEHFVTDSLLPTRKITHSNIKHLNMIKDSLDEEAESSPFYEMLFDKIDGLVEKQDSISSEFNDAIEEGRFVDALTLLKDNEDLANSWVQNKCGVPEHTMWIAASSASNKKDNYNDITNLLLEYNKHLPEGQVLHHLTDRIFLERLGGKLALKLMAKHVDYNVTNDKNQSVLDKIDSYSKLGVRDADILKKTIDMVNKKNLEKALTKTKTNDSTKIIPDFTPRSRVESRVVSNDKSAKKLAELLQQDVPDFKKAKKIIDSKKGKKLAYRDMKFPETDVEQSVTAYLTGRFDSFSDETKGDVCQFIQFLNTKCPRNEAFKDLKTTIRQLLKTNPKSSIDTYSPLLQMMIHPRVVEEDSSSELKSDELKELTVGLKEAIPATPRGSVIEESEEADSSSVESVENTVQENSGLASDEVLEESPTKIVEDTIIECLKNFNDEDFDFDETVNKLVRDTMGYAKTIPFERLPDIVANIEATYEFEDDKDPAWQDFRQTIGAIVNKTADHYIEENARVDKTQKLLMLCCLTVIGAIIPLLYYLLKVKPTQAASPLAVYEMSINTFNKITEEKNPAADDISHDDVSDFVSDGGTNHLMWPSLIDRRESDENQAHLTNNDNDHTTLEPTVLFNTNSDDSDKNGNLFNGALASNQFVNNDLEVRWITLRGLQAKPIEEALEALKDDNDQDFKTVIGAAAG